MFIKKNERELIASDCNDVEPPPINATCVLKASGFPLLPMQCLNSSSFSLN